MRRRPAAAAASAAPGGDALAAPAVSGNAGPAVPQPVAAPARPAVPARRRGRGGAARAGLDVAHAWKILLETRKRSRAAATAGELAEYKAKVLNDRARARRAMGVEGVRAQCGVAVDNDTSLPPAKRSRRCEDFERWCNYNSWSMCRKCGGLQPRDLTQGSLTMAQGPLHSDKKCTRCQANRKQPVLSPDDVPALLRDLSEQASRELVCPTHAPNPNLCCSGTPVFLFLRIERANDFESALFYLAGAAGLGGAGG